MLIIYLFLALPAFIIKLYTNNYSIEVSEIGHLIWNNWTSDGIIHTYLFMVYSFFLFFSLFIEKKYLLLFFIR